MTLHCLFFISLFILHSLYTISHSPPDLSNKKYFYSLTTKDKFAFFITEHLALTSFVIS